MVRNILLVLIAVINWFIMAIVMSLFTNDTMTVILTSTLIMGGLVLLSLTPAAEKIFRITNGMHPMNPTDESHFRTILSRVISHCGINREIDIFMVNSNTPNMMVLGGKTLAVTTGLWHAGLPDEEIEAILAHEVGHLVNGDSRVLIAASTMNFVGQIASWILTVLVAIVGVFSGIAAAFGDRSGIGVFVGMLISLFLVWTLRFISWVLTQILNLSFHAISRAQEYKADEFARQNGYGPGLAVFLRRIDGFTTDEKNFISQLFSTHPRPSERIQRLTAGTVQAG
jgi:Zn-dependent protease with chaperone function